MERQDQSVTAVFRVVRATDGQEIQRFIDLIGACVLWVKSPTKLRVEELATGSNTAIREVPREECCRSLRRWSATNKHFVSADERADMEQLVREAC